MLGVKSGLAIQRGYIYMVTVLIQEKKIETNQSTPQVEDFSLNAVKKSRC
jgi:hypothetical protein